jgi:ATP-dependent Clp protease ATP-binding subunit ClpA
MLFENGIFTPHLLNNERTEAVLLAATDHASGKIRPSDILLAAIDSRDVRILANLRLFLDPGCSPQELRKIIEAYNPTGTTHSYFNGERRWFSPETLPALDEFGSKLTDGEFAPGTILASWPALENGDAESTEIVEMRVGYVMLELLLSCVLTHLDDEDRAFLTPLNAIKAAERFLKIARSIIQPPTFLFDDQTGGTRLLRSGEFSESGWTIMEYAATRAADLGYDRILPPHCFLALLSEPEGVTEHLIRLQAQPDITPAKVAQVVVEIFRIADLKKEPVQLHLDTIREAMKDILEAAQLTARMWDAEKIDPAHLLFALLENMPPRLASALQGSPVKLDLKKMRAHLDQYLIESQTLAKREVPFRIPTGLLPSEDLTYRAMAKLLPKAVIDQHQKHTDHYDVMTRALYRRTNNHVLITGLRGVGKTTLVWELARRAAAGEIPFLKRKRFLWVDCRDVAPQESKDKLAGILSHVAGRTDLILCLDGLGPLLRAESGGNNKLLLRGTLKESRVQIIGVMSNNDFEDLFSSDYEMLELFTRVKVEEPGEETALAIVRQVCLELQQDYKVTIDEPAIKRSVDLSASYILNERLPVKAIKILRRVCEELDYNRTKAIKEQAVAINTDAAAVKAEVKVEQIIKVIAEISGVPEERLVGQARKHDYKKDLESAVVGQDEAVKAVATTLQLIKGGSIDPGKPAAVMLFAGLTGVGKTELAKALAQLYSSSKRLQTYTMGNFTEPHSVSGIIGVPPGYVGHDQGGRLINDLNSDPYGVFLLDEADKAHPDVWKPFLNLFDEGWIVDARGVKAFANQAIFILTSNKGHEIIAKECRVVNPNMDEISRKVKNALTDPTNSGNEKKGSAFTPELLARIDRIIVFRPLDESAMRGICEKLIEKMKKTWAEKREKTLVIPCELIDYIAKRSHLENVLRKGEEGGRIVNKLITDLITARLQQEQIEHEEEYNYADTIELSFKIELSSLPFLEEQLKMELEKQLKAEQPHQRIEQPRINESITVKVNFSKQQPLPPAASIGQVRQVQGTSPASN